MKAFVGEEDNVWLISQIGVTLGALKRYEEGMEYLRKAEELGRNDGWLNSEIGWQLARMEKHEEAVEYFKKAEELGRNDSWLYNQLGGILEF